MYGQPPAQRGPDPRWSLEGAAIVKIINVRVEKMPFGKNGVDHTSFIGGQTALVNLL